MSTTLTVHDVIIVGSGPAGYTACSRQENSSTAPTGRPSLRRAQVVPRLATMRLLADTAAAASVTQNTDWISAAL